jgi:hypothetical protein
MAQAPAPAARIVDRIDDNHLVTLKGNTHPAARAQNDRGRVSPDLPMGDLVLVLKRAPEQQAAFDKFVASQYDPASPNFHHWLEPEEVGEEFGPALGDISAIEGWLRGHGFSIGELSNDHMSIRFSGTAAQVESAFHTEIHNLAFKNGEKHIANMSDPQIPAALAAVVAGPQALHNFFPRPLHRLGSKVTFNREKGGWQRTGNPPALEAKMETKAEAKVGDSSKPARIHPMFTTNDGSGDVLEDVGPYDLATIYNVLPEWSKNIDGTGQTIAVAGTSNIDLTDVSTFRSSFGLPASPSGYPKVIITNSDPGDCATADPSCDSDLTENTLDVEWSGAVAKGAKIVLVTSAAATATTDPLLLSEQYIVNNKTAPVMNVSYGLCELGMGTAGNTQYNNLWQTAAGEGIAVIVAAGDSGSASCDDGGDANGTPYAAEYGLSVSGIASTPYNTAVGGTDFAWCDPVSTTCTASPYWNSTNNTTTQASAVGYIPEVLWNDSCVNPISIEYMQSLASQIGVSNPVSAEDSCNFVLENYYYIYQATSGSLDISGFLDTVGGSGGKSSCTTSDGSTPTSCAGGYAKPSWQTGVTGIPADGKRDLPDLSFFASNGFIGSAYLICVSANGACTYSSSSEPVYQEVGGTSVASPVMAGVMALINQKTGAPQGNPNTELYTLAAKQNYTGCKSESVTNSSGCYFNDIDTSSNAQPCDFGGIAAVSPDCNATGSYDSQSDTIGILPGYDAVTGFDLATGLGSLNVANVVSAWPAAAVPVVSLSPGGLTFASTVEGVASASQPITLKNTGTAALSLSGTGRGITITGTDPSSFSQTNTCGTSLAAGGSCTINVTFKPAAVGALTATVSVGDNASGSPQTIGVKGTGTAGVPVVSLSATTLAFPSTAVGASSQKQVTITNKGTGALTLTGTGKGISITGTNEAAFTQTNTCGTSVAAGKSCVVTVTFKPASSGARKAYLDIADNASGTPQLVTLTGTATAPAVSLSHTSLAFPATQIGTAAPTQSVTLTNTGNGTLTGVSIKVIGTNYASFSQTNTCGTSVAAGKNCTITVTFKPGSTGARVADVNIDDNAAGEPQKIALSGTGTQPLVSLSHTSLAFPATQVGTAAPTQSVTLSNTGSGALTGIAITVVGTNFAAFSQTNTCGTSVAAGKDCTITVTFKPASSGARVADVNIADNASGSPQKIALSGTAVEPAVSLSATSLTFPATTHGTAAPVQKITLTNTGTGALSLAGTGKGITITGTNSAAYSQTNTCGTSVAAGKNCTISVTFKPATAGSRVAAVTIADNAPNTPQSVKLTGTAK